MSKRSEIRIALKNLVVNGAEVKLDGLKFTSADVRKVFGNSPDIKEQFKNSGYSVEIVSGDDGMLGLTLGMAKFSKSDLIGIFEEVSKSWSSRIEFEDFLKMESVRQYASEFNNGRGTPKIRLKTWKTAAGRRVEFYVTERPYLDLELHPFLAKDLKKWRFGPAYFAIKNNEAPSATFQALEDERPAVHRLVEAANQVPGGIRLFYEFQSGNKCKIWNPNQSGPSFEVDDSEDISPAPIDPSFIRTPAVPAGRPLEADDDMA